MTVLLANERSDAVRLDLAGTAIQHLALVGTLDGVAPLFAGGRSGPGTGRLRSTGDGLTFAYRAPGSATFGGEIQVTADGDYVVEDGDDPAAYLRIRVATAFVLAPGEADVLLGDRYNELGPDDVSAAEALPGATEDTEYTLTNEGPANTAYDVRLWLDPATVDLSVSDDGIVFVTPTTPGTGLLLGDLAAGASVSVWTRRIIAAASPSDPKVTNVLHWDWIGH